MSRAEEGGEAPPPRWQAYYANNMTEWLAAALSEGSGAETGTYAELLEAVKGCQAQSDSRTANKQLPKAERGKLAPSHAVDEVWHQHMRFQAAYRKMSAALLGGRLWWYGAISKRHRMRRCVYRQSMGRWWQARVAAGPSQAYLDACLVSEVRRVAGWRWQNRT